MSTQTPPRPDVVHEEPEAPDLSVGELLRRVYALFHNKRFGLLLILAMAVLTLLGVLFMQAPTGVLADPESRTAWLNQARQRYGGWTDVLALLGIFDMFASPAFVLVNVLLALSIIACTTHRWPQLSAQAFHPHLRVRDTFFDHARVSASTVLDETPDQASARLRAALLKARYRTVADADGTLLYADRNRMAPFGTVIAHAAFVVILVGVLVTGTMGVRNDDLVVPVGERVAVGHDSGLEVQARNFTDSYNADGTPTDYVSDLVLFSNGQQVAQQVVRVNAPLRWGGWSINQASFGIAADLEVKDASGGVLYAGAVPLVYRTDDDLYSYGKVQIPARDLQVYVITPASGQVVPDIPAGRAQVEVYRGASRTPVLQKLLTPGQPVQAEDATWTFVRENQYTGLMASRDPGAPIVWSGAVLLAIGTCWTMFLRHHRLWLRVEPTDAGTRVRVASPDRHDVTFDRGVRRLVASLETPATTTEDHHA